MPRENRDTPDPDLETDERFPSGPWIGYYHQGSLQSRQRLALTFKNGQITGTGRDPAGTFGVRGAYTTSSGRCSLTKSYETHRIEYQGQADGDGIGGGWTLTLQGLLLDAGHFRIWPDTGAGGEAESAKAEEPVGASA
jgi:hypothetical protein